MVYRIRYTDAATQTPAEAEVNANSPTEALVKLRHASDAERIGRVESVSAQQPEFDPVDAVGNDG